MSAFDEFKGVVADLSRCTFLPGSWDKRFVHEMATKLAADEFTLFSERQRDQLRRLHVKYERQIKSRRRVA